MLLKQKYRNHTKITLNCTVYMCAKITIITANIGSTIKEEHLLENSE